jgi:hypothetical protein
MAYPKLEIYPRANALTGTEDVLISQGRVNKKVSTQAIADLAAPTGTIGNGTVPTWGPLTGFANGDLLAISGGVLVKASNSDPAKMPCIGIFEEATGELPASIRTSGRSTVLSSLVADTQYFVGVNGALTTTAPSASGTVSQRICIGTSTTAAFVQVGEPVTNS